MTSNASANPTLADYISSFGQTATPRPAVTPATEDELLSAQELIFGGGPENRRMLATAIAEGNDVASHPFIQDYLNMDNAAIRQRYGDALGREALNLTNERLTVHQLGTMQRDGAAVASDTWRGVAAGALNGLGGLAAFGTGLVSDEGGAAVAEATENAAGYLREGQSPILQMQREQDGYRAELDRQDIEEAYQHDVEAGNSYPWLRRVGREILAEGSNLAGNPALAGDLIAEGSGSLVTSLGINGIAVRAGARAILASRGIRGTQATRILRTPAGRQLMRELAERGMPATIGLLEGGGTYASIQSEIQSMSEEELMEASPEYRDLRLGGFTHEAAQNRIANTAALEGGAIQGLVGAATGSLVSRFESDPLGVRSQASNSFVDSLRNFGGNILRETTEETIQGGTGGLIADAAIQRHADENRAIGEGLGTDLVQGAVAGAGMAGVVGAPRLGFDAAVNTGRGVIAAGQSRLDRINQERDDASPTGGRATTQAFQDLAETLPTISAALNHPVTPLGQDEEPGAGREEDLPVGQEGTSPSNQETSAESINIPTGDEMTVGQRLHEAATMSAEEANTTPATVRNLFRNLFLGHELMEEGTEVSRAAAVAAVGQEILSGNLSPEVERDAALWLHEQAETLSGVRDVPLDNLAPELQEDVSRMQNAIDTIMSNEKIQGILDRANEISASDFQAEPQVTAENVQSPEVQEALRRTISMATSNPAGVNATFVNQILNQMGESLRPVVRKRLQAAARLAQMAVDIETQKAGLEADAQAQVSGQETGKNAKIQKTNNIFQKGISDVREDVRSRGRREDKNQWGLSRHVGEIVGAISRGATEEAQTYLDNLRNFAQHYQNKLSAYQESAANGGTKTFFEVWDGGAFLPVGKEGTKPVWLNRNSPASVMLSEEAKLDAKLVSDVYNMMLTLYGDKLNGTSLDGQAALNASQESVQEGSTEAEAAPAAQAAEVPAKAEETPNKEAAPEEQVPETSQESIEDEVALIDDGDIVEDVAPKKAKKNQDPISRFQDLVQELNAIDSDALVGIKRRARRAAELVRTRTGERIYDAQEIIYDLGYDIGDLGYEKLGLAFDDVAEDLLALSDELFNETVEDQTDDSTTGQEDGAVEATETGKVSAQQEAEASRSEADGTQGRTEGAEGRSEAPAGEVGTDVTLTFENLAKDKSGVSPFERAYRIVAERAGLLSQENPLQSFLARLTTSAAVNSEMNLSVPVADEQLSSLRTLLGEMGSVIDRMNARLNTKMTGLKKLKKDGGGTLTPLEALEYPAKDFINFRVGHALALVDTTTGKYDERLVQAAALAALHWVLNVRAPGKMDIEDVAKLFGVDVSEVTPQQMYAASVGFYGKTAVEGLSREIMAFWGVESRQETSDGDVRGIAEGLAIELLLAMNDNLVTQVPVEIHKYDQDGQLITVKSREGNVIPHVLSLVPENPKTQADVVRVRENGSIIADALLAEGQTEQPKAHIGKAPPLEASTKGPMTRGADIRAALQNHNETPFYKNNSYLNLMRAFGKDAYMRLLGYREFDEETTHIMDAESIHGRNRGLERAWDETMAHDARVQAYAEKNNLSPEEVATHFEWYVGSNGRIMARGFSGQADKTMREAYVATRSKLDLSNDADRARFWVTVAQSVGIKTELETREVATAAAEALMDQLPETLSILKNLDAGTLTDNQVALIENELSAAGMDVNPKSLHALMAVAKYEVVRDTYGFTSEEARSFTHDLALEADGKTDGPMNGLLHYITESFDEEQMSNLAKGGLYVNEEGKTLNEHYVGDLEGDLYMTAAKLTEVFVESFLAGIPKGEYSEQARQRAMNQAQATLRFLTYFGDLKIEDGNITITRNTLKNPLTITMYGSGADGIAGKVVSAAMENFYGRLSELMQLQQETGNTSLSLQDLSGLEGYSQLNEDIQHLVTSKLVTTKKGSFVSDVMDAKTKRKVSVPRQRQLRHWQLSRDNFNMFKANVLEALVQPMELAIQEKLGSAHDTMQLAIASTQIQSVIIQERFQQAVDAKKAELKAETGRETQLSQKDLKDIFHSLAKLGVIIEGMTDNEHYLNLTDDVRTTDGKTDFARGFNEEMSGDSSVRAPDSAGVSVAPMLTISRGDARMMVKYYAGNAVSKRTLQVFDGLEMAADEIESVSENINKAWAEMALENPLKDVADSFRAWQRQNPLEGITERAVFRSILRTGDDRLPAKIRVYNKAYVSILQTALRDLKIPEAQWPADALIDENGRPNFTTPVEPMKNGKDEAVNARMAKDLREAASVIIDQMSEELNDASRKAQARKEVLSGITFSADHMASGESPHTHRGGEVIPGDKSAVLEELNRRYSEALERLERADNVSGSRPVIAAPSASFVARVQELGKSIGSGDIRQLTMEDALTLFGLDGVSENHQRILRALRRVLPEFQILFGDAKALTEHRNRNYPKNVSAAPIQKGQIDFSNGMIYISNQAHETLLHELLHAALFRQLSNYFMEDGAKLSKNEKAAIENIQQLMDEFLALDFSYEDLSAAQALEILRGEMLSNMASDPVAGKAAAMAEFISWGLTNQNISQTLGTVKVQGRLRTLANKVVRFVKSLLGLPANMQLDMFSNLELNTASLLIDGRSWMKAHRNERLNLSGVLNQVSGLSVDQRLVDLTERFSTKIKAHLQSRRVDPNKANRKHAEAERRKMVLQSVKAVNTFSQFGFLETPQQRSAFRQIQAALASSMSFDGPALVRIQKLFSHVMKEFDAAELPGNEVRWEQMFNLLTGTYGTETDLEGRSNLMASFLALSQVDPEFRKMLSGLKVPKGEVTSDGTLDGVLNSRTNQLMNTLAEKISGEGTNNSSIQEALDNLTLTLAQIEQDDLNLVEKKANSLLGTGDAKGRQVLSALSERLENFGNSGSRNLRKTQRVQTMDLLRSGAKLAAALIDEGRGEAMANQLTSFGNQSKRIPTTVLEAMNEVFGMTDQNRGILGMVNIVRTSVQGVRQDHREILPKIFAEQFSRPLEKSEWTHLYRGIAKTDIAALLGRFQAAEIRSFLGANREWNNAVKTLEEEISSMAPSLAREYFHKADQLAEFMVNGTPSSDNNLLRNALAISMLLNEKNQKQAKSTPQLVTALDELTSLYAIGKLGEETQQAVLKLIEDEKAGVDFLTFYLADLRRHETEKHAVNDVARLNGYKGFIPAEIREGATLRVADDSEGPKLASLGYTRIGNYVGSGVEGGKRGYYISSVAGSNTYSQGAMQTVNSSFMGVDPRTGYSVNGISAGRIRGQYLSTIKARLKAQGNRKGNEPLMPVFNDVGEVVAYERSMAPERLAALDPNSHLGEMIGAWAGRQAEEELAQHFNEKLVDEVWKAWDKGRQDGRADEFIDLSSQDLTDPVHLDAWKMVPAEMRAYIRHKFGEDGFRVRKDMVNNTVGYREASVGDIWTEMTRMDPKVQKAFHDTATVIMGKDAFRNLVTAEKYWQAGISVAKTTIVIRSIIVPVSNLASNFLWLMATGVSLTKISKGFTSKLVEINQYLANQERKVRINALLARHRNDKVMTKRLTTELKSLDDSNHRMSIWPLIEAGEFSTISEGLTEADAAIGNGSLSDWMQSKIDQVPAQLGTIGRYAMITRDTALFKGMSRATQYGDFLAKAVLYDHLMSEGNPQNEVMNRITEEFVNYNLQPGRTRSYAESMGMTWFWAYKLRVLKRALSTMRNNPFRALLMTAGMPLMPDVPMVDAGTPITDNMVSVIGKGSLGYSVGLDQLWSAPGLNPWANLVN